MSVVTESEPPVASRFDRTDWTTIAAMGAVVSALHVFGWGVLIYGVAPQHITLGSAGVFGVGLGVTAYLLGVRHAFDADHIAATYQNGVLTVTLPVAARAKPRRIEITPGAREETKVIEPSDSSDQHTTT